MVYDSFIFQNIKHSVSKNIRYCFLVSCHENFALLLITELNHKMWNGIKAPMATYGMESMYMLRMVCLLLSWGAKKGVPGSPQPHQYALISFLSGNSQKDKPMPLNAYLAALLDEFMLPFDCKPKTKQKKDQRMTKLCSLEKLLEE